MLIPLKQSQLSTLIPSVATAGQFKYAFGNPNKILQRILISSIGGVITFLISVSQDRNQTYSLWLILCVVFFLYILWGPIVEASLKNSSYKKFNYSALFEGRILDIYQKSKLESTVEQTDRQGKLRLIENRRTWLFLELEDEDGYIGKLGFPYDQKHNSIRIGSQIRCIVFASSKDFTREITFSDAYLPKENLWVGEYPSILRPAFIELCSYFLR
tara:strand:- start:17506 stop:18150 length:645 start_codon:yes stop_codon:yes gene_type:complete